MISSCFCIALIIIKWKSNKQNEENPFRGSWKPTSQGTSNQVTRDMLQNNLRRFLKFHVPSPILGDPDFVDEFQVSADEAPLTSFSLLLQIKKLAFFGRLYSITVMVEKIIWGFFLPFHQNSRNQARLIQGVNTASFSFGSCRGYPFSCPFQPWRLLMAPSSTLKASNIWLSPFHAAICLVLPSGFS